MVDVTHENFKQMQREQIRIVRRGLKEEKKRMLELRRQLTSRLMNSRQSPYAVIINDTWEQEDTFKDIADFK